MSMEAKSPIDPTEAAVRLARELDGRGIDYAIGGAIALAFCSRPDRDWVRRQLVDLVGPHDPRVIQWDELVDEIKS